MMLSRTFILPFLFLAALAAPLSAAPPASAVPAAPANQNNQPNTEMNIQINQQGGAGGGTVVVHQQGAGGQQITIIQQGGEPPVTFVNGQPVPADAASTSASATPAKPAVPAIPVEQLNLPALVAALGGENWPARQKAEDQLTAAGPDVLAPLDPFLARATDAEVLWRLERIYRTITPPERYAADGQPAYMGINFAMVSAGNDARLADREWGVRLDSVLPDSPAQQAGLAVDDLIVAINGEKFIGSYTDGAANQALVERIQSYGVGADVKLVFFRGQERREATVKLAARPDGYILPLGPARKWAHYWTKHLADLRPAAAK